MYNWTFDWNWAWGWAVFVGVIAVLAIFIVPWILFLLNVRGLLARVSERNRGMAPDYVWLNFIPLFGLGWFVYMVVKVRDSVQAEYRSRGWRPNDDFGYGIGLTAGILAICSLVLNWVPFFGGLVGLAWLICWIVYWVKTNDLKNRLGREAAWGNTAPSPYAQPGRPLGPAPYYTTPETWAPPGPALSGPAAAATVAATSAAVAASGDPASQPRVQTGWCGACGTAVLAGDRFCRVCGLPLPQTPQAATQAAAAPAPAPAPEEPAASPDEGYEPFGDGAAPPGEGTEPPGEDSQSSSV